MGNDGKSYAISPRKAGRQWWDSPDIDTATDYVRQNPGMLDRNRLRVPSQKLEKIELLGWLKTPEIQSYVFKGVGLNAYPVIESRNPDLKAFCKSTKNQLNVVDSAKFIDDKEPATFDMIDTVHYLNDDELLIKLKKHARRAS